MILCSRPCLFGRISLSVDVFFFSLVRVLRMCCFCGFVRKTWSRLKIAFILSIYGDCNLMGEKLPNSMSNEDAGVCCALFPNKVCTHCLNLQCCRHRTQHTRNIFSISVVDLCVRPQDKWNIRFYGTFSSIRHWRYFHNSPLCVCVQWKYSAFVFSAVGKLLAGN